MSVEMTPCHLNHLKSSSVARQHSAWTAPSASGGMGVDAGREPSRANCLGTQESGAPRTGHRTISHLSSYAKVMHMQESELTPYGRYPL
jgi:hypothetical protein